MTIPWLPAAQTAHNPQAVARILKTLPEWFGREESNAEYIHDAERLETWTVTHPETHEVVGIMLIAQHYPVEAEIHLLAVDAAFHRYGIGTSLINAFEEEARNRGIRLIQVKTLGESFFNEPYQRTRIFYKAVGFLPLEETDLWGEDTPCLIMVKAI